jgi:hypothetical protein
MTEYRKEQQRLTNDIVRKLLLDYKIVEVTTKRQAKNGTRCFQLPDGGKISSFESGYVRRQHKGADRAWQLNKRYIQNVNYVSVSDSFKVKTYKFAARTSALIPSELSRIRYILLYCKNNFTKQIRITTDNINK